MNIQNIKKMKSERGFTIVELLIVIVVIGILAAIVIVAYNGVQNKARDTDAQTDVTSIVKIAEAVNADQSINGYPTGTDDASLTSSFNATSSAQLPNSLSVKYVSSSTTVDNTQYSSILSDANSRKYWVKVCQTSANTQGLVIYYPIRTSGTVASQTAGQGC